MKKVLVIAYYFPPLGWSGVQRTLKFVKYLRDFGWDPVVVTVGKTQFSILDESLLEEVPKEIEVIRIDDLKFKDITDEIKEKMREYTKASFDILSDKKLKYEYEKEIEDVFEKLRSLFLLPDSNAVWTNNVIKEISNRLDLKNIDIVYTTSGPYSTHLIGHYLKKKYNLPWVCDFRDEWTNNPYFQLDNNSLRFKIERNLETSIVNNADKVVTFSYMAKQHFKDIFNIKNVIDITNGYDEDDFKYISSEVSQKKFKIVYNGSFYSTINPYTFIQALLNLIKNNDINKEFIQVSFVGNCEKSIIDRVKSMVKYKEIIEYKGYISHRESLREANSANLLLLILGSNPKSKSIYTGKVFEYLRLKRPILALSPKGSIVEQLLHETKCGVNVEYDNIEGIQKYILKFYNDWLNGIKFNVNENEVKKYDRIKLTEKLSQIFELIVNK